MRSSPVLASCTMPGTRPSHLIEVDLDWISCDYSHGRLSSEGLVSGSKKPARGVRVSGLFGS